MDDNKLIWSTENLVFFGTWLIQRGDYGYGFLCIHGSCLGLKIGTLLKLKWYDFINTELFASGLLDCCHNELIIEDNKKDTKQILPLSYYTRYITEKFFNDNYNKHELETDSFIYINTKTKKVLSTTSLNRELNKLYSEFEEFIFKTTLLKLRLRPLKSNTMEIAWARDMVNKYNCTKKVFILVSKHMGHRTVNDTINLLELQTNENIELSYDMYNPTSAIADKMESLFDDNKEIQKYLLNLGHHKIAYITQEYIERYVK